MCKVYTGYHGTSEIEHGMCACTVDNPLAKAKGLSRRTGAQTMLCLSLSTYGPDEFANSLDQRSWHKMRISTGATQFAEQNRTLLI